MEPGLGMGRVVGVDRDHVDIHFPLSRCRRRYAQSSAPLRRVAFKVGDTIRAANGDSMRLVAVVEKDQLYRYQGLQAEWSEEELDDRISFTTPLNRLRSGFVDRNRDYQLRHRAMVLQHNRRKSELRGFIGGRIDLIPHQLYIAHRVVSQSALRVLLSDETGLGKTIEACLILHHLLAHGRIERVLILVPESLVHQWFIELYRKFNLFFRIFDEAYCLSLQSADPTFNPFLDDQWAICSLKFLTGDAKRLDQALAAGWDLLVVDEAHHLIEPSAEYALVAALSGHCPYLILLTATPEQFGHRSHFSRLKLLDPARYFDFTLFEKQEAGYTAISRLAERIGQPEKLTLGEIRHLQQLLPETATTLSTDLKKRLAMEEEFRWQTLQSLLDRYGVGRPVFRNTRSVLSGFPQREVHLMPLPGQEEALTQMTAEFRVFHLLTSEDDLTLDYHTDPRFLWLVTFLRRNRKRKVLLICRSQTQVRALEGALRRRIKVEMALFHENLSLLQRDRYAAWFSRPDGAQICLCSEIGSEGRNFQFAHDLVLFDLPMNPELLEQRIGRLDRIGQTETIHVHVPYVIGSEYEMLARWYQEGLDAFANNVPGAFQIFAELGDRLHRLLELKQISRLPAFIALSKRRCRAIAAQIRRGRDRLLELNSYEPQAASHLVEKLQQLDEKRTLERFMLDVFELYGLQVHELAHRTFHVNALALSNPEFPLPMNKEEEFTVTFDRKTACRHEEVEFLTFDHPMVLGVLDLLLGSEKGNCAMAVADETDTEEMLLEAVYVLQCVAEKSLQIDRFLPPRPLRVLVDQNLQDAKERGTALSLHDPKENDAALTAFVGTDPFNAMLQQCQTLAGKMAETIMAASVAAMEEALLREKTRLIELAKVNQNIKIQEIKDVQRQVDWLRSAIRSAELRLDSLRLIRCVGSWSSSSH